MLENILSIGNSVRSRDQSLTETTFLSYAFIEHIGSYTDIKILAAENTKQRITLITVKNTMSAKCYGSIS